MGIIRRTAATMFAAAAVLALSACAQPAGSISADDVAGTWGDENAAFLELASDGSLTGNDGCNQLTGSWSIDDDQISFDDVASTRMACPDGQATLEGLDSAHVSGDTMTVYAEDEAQIATLERN